MLNGVWLGDQPAWSSSGSAQIDTGKARPDKRLKSPIHIIPSSDVRDQLRRAQSIRNETVRVDSNSKPAREIECARAPVAGAQHAVGAKHTAWRGGAGDLAHAVFDLVERRLRCERTAVARAGFEHEIFDERLEQVVGDRVGVREIHDVAAVELDDDSADAALDIGEILDLRILPCPDDVEVGEPAVDEVAGGFAGHEGLKGNADATTRAGCARVAARMAERN